MCVAGAWDRSKGNWVVEDERHFMISMQCPAYEDERKEMRRKSKYMKKKRMIPTYCSEKSWEITVQLAGKEKISQLRS